MRVTVNSSKCINATICPNGHAWMPQKARMLQNVWMGNKGHLFTVKGTHYVCVIGIVVSKLVACSESFAYVKRRKSRRQFSMCIACSVNHCPLEHMAVAPYHDVRNYVCAICIQAPFKLPVARALAEAICPVWILIRTIVQFGHRPALHTLLF